MKKNVLVMMLALGSAVIAANDDIDLPINGDFRGSPSGYSPAPGWTLTADGGGARILPTADRDDFCLELSATATRPQSVVSELYPLPGSILKLELKLGGTGTAAVGYETFDEARRMVISSDRLVVPLSAYDQKVKRYFTLTVPAKYIRIRLTAEIGSIARFRDVDADVSGPAIAAPQQSGAATGVIAAPAPAPMSAPAPAPVPAAQPAVQPVNPQPAASYTVRLLQNDKYFFYTFLGQDEHYETSIPVGADIDFSIGEDPNNGLYWKVLSYDAGICRVKLEHDRDGIFPFRRDKAEIELKAIRPGKTDVIFICGTKRFTVHFTAL